MKKYKFAMPMPTPEQLYEDPFKQAEYAYDLVESEVVGDGTK